ncbi:hypothetical protein [Candidatus Uabimicrobium sp. HlEnr_7]|uniref:hypothetical protein n=1 Tax=Candidatus Uabimicrobium helgolandensis TaxID=3095367 RepID=UPI003555CA0B
MYKVIIICLMATSYICAQKAQLDIIPNNFQFEAPLAGEDFITPRSMNRYVSILHIWSASPNLAEVDPIEVTYASLATGHLKFLNKEYRKYKDKGLRVVAAHVNLGSQKMPDLSAYQAVPRSIKMPVYHQFRSTKRIPGLDVPYIFVFDVGGKLAYHGKNIREGVNKAKQLLRSYTSNRQKSFNSDILKSEVRDIVRGRSLGRIYNKLEKKAESSDEATKKEAKKLLNNLEQIYRSDIGELDITKKENPPLYIKKIKKVLQNWKGYKKADTLAKDISKTQKTKLFRKKIKAYSLYSKARKIYFGMKVSALGSTSFKDEKFQKRNRRSLGQLRGYCTFIVKKYSDTLFVVWAKDILRRFE